MTSTHPQAQPSPTSGTSRTSGTSVPDDSLDELPPIDGEEDDTESPVPDLEDDEMLAGDDDPFDDSTAEGDALPEMDVADEGDETGWLVDAQDDDRLDVGAADLLGAHTDEERESKALLLDNDELGVGDEDFGLGEERARVPGWQDAGEEGPEADDEALREQDLPELDADDDGEADDDSFFDELPQAEAEPDAGAEGAEGGAAGAEADQDREGRVDRESDVGRAPWSTRPWETVGGRPATGAVHALACATRGILAAGRTIVRVDLEGAVDAVAAAGLGAGDGDVTALCFDGALLVAATERGGVLVSRDGGATFTQANGWRERVSAHEAASGLEIALGADQLWGRTAQGKLLFSTDQGSTWESADVDGFVLAIAIDDRGKLVALASALGGAEVVRGSGVSLSGTGVPADLEVTRVPGPVPEVRPGAQASIAARGSAVAFAVRGAGVQSSPDGQRWVSVPGTVGALDLAFIDGAGTLVAAVASVAADADDHRVWLVRAAADGDARVVAVIDGDPAGADGPVVLAWDEAHGVVWLGGPFGLSALEPPMTR